MALTCPAVIWRGFSVGNIGVIYSGVQLKKTLTLFVKMVILINR